MSRRESKRGEMIWEDDCGDVGVQQMMDTVYPVVQGLLATGGMRPWCGAAVVLPQYQVLEGDVWRGSKASGKLCPDAGAVAGAAGVQGRTAKDTQEGRGGRQEKRRQ